MKRNILLLFCLLLLVGCSKKEKMVNDINEEPENNAIVEEPVDTYIDDNPIKVGLYMNGKLINEYNKVFINNQDIASFDVYFTDELDVGSSNTKNNFNKYYGNYDNIDKYKIGYYVSFEANNKKYEKMVLDPDVEFALTPYIYLYLYDDIHQADGAWYSHVTKDEFNENTILSSIKLYMAEKGNEITSPITVEVFTYDGEEDFDDLGYYRGVSKHKVIINNK